MNAMIGLATPVVTALVAAVFGMKIAGLAWMGVLLAVGGDAILSLDGFSVAAAEGSSISIFIYGVLLSVFAMFTRGAKTVLQDKLMNNYSNDEEHKSLTPLQSWALQGPMLIALGMLGTVVKEGLAPWQALPAAVASPALPFMIGNVALAACLNISAVYAIKMLGAPAAQIAGKLNVLVVASLSCALLGETLTLKQGASTLLIIGGATLFEKAQKNKINDIHGLMKQLRAEKYDAVAEKC
jgi:drug/metabolite transporter (DMT)-like permease